MGFFGLSTSEKKVKKTESSPGHRHGKPSTSRPPPARRAQQAQASPPPPLPSRPQPTPPPLQHQLSPRSQPQPQWAGEEQPRLEFRPAGYLPAPPGWTPPPAPFPYQCQIPAPIVVNQHYYITAPPAQPVLPPPPVRGPYGGTAGAISKLHLGSVVNLANEVLPSTLQMSHQMFDDDLPAWHSYGSQLLNQGAAVVDQLSTKFNDVMTLIDLERFRGHENELFSLPPAPPPTPALTGAAEPPSSEGFVGSQAPGKRSKRETSKDHPKGQTTAMAANVLSGNSFSKVELYSNSKLPMKLPPLNLYITTWPIICLAAQYAERVYEKPRGAERDTHVEADWRTGSKAMVVKSVPMDYMNTIVFAIRGTATFMDWAVNLNMAPTSPAGFLDDPGNFCHAGFLSVARKMIKPVAARIRRLLEEDPPRSSFSLLLTGHSAGGAIASLLYSHMLSRSPAAESELSLLAGCFRRIHCITFGTPPVSLLPLATPPSPSLRKSLFLSFVNEGDPVARADKAYVKSLLELFASPPPPTPSSPQQSKSKSSSSPSKAGRSSSSSPPKKATSSSPSSTSNSSFSSRSGPVWKVPPSTLSSAGRIVVLRSGDPKARLKGKKTVAERLDEGVVAQVATDEQLREVIWGDPVAHVMRLYAGRIETLAVGAVTVKGY